MVLIVTVVAGLVLCAICFKRANTQPVENPVEALFRYLEILKEEDVEKIKIVVGALKDIGIERGKQCREKCEKSVAHKDIAIAQANEGEDQIDGSASDQQNGGNKLTSPEEELEDLTDYFVQCIYDIAKATIPQDGNQDLASKMQEKLNNAIAHEEVKEFQTPL